MTFTFFFIHFIYLQNIAFMVCFSCFVFRVVPAKLLPMHGKGMSLSQAAQNTPLNAKVCSLSGATYRWDCLPPYPECNSHVTLQGSFTGYFESAIAPPGDGCQGMSSLVVTWFPLQDSWDIHVLSMWPSAFWRESKPFPSIQPDSDLLITWLVVSINTWVARIWNAD